MKKTNFFMFLFLITTGLFTGCGDKNDDLAKAITVQNNATLTQIVFADDTQGTSDITFSTTDAWSSTITQGTNWLTITPEEGDAAGSHTISISLLPNTTGAERSATITIMCNGESIPVTVTQQAVKRGNSQSKPADVYVAGYEGNYGDERATLWKNGIAQTLSNKDSRAYSVFVSGSDVYVAGKEENIPTVWKNGVAQQLPLDNISNIYGAEAYSVFVSNNDVYVAGRETKPDGSGNFAKLWKNGVGQNLTSGAFPAEAKSVYVFGSDVYVTGYEYNAKSLMIGKLWKNGVEQIITDGTLGSTFNSVFVSNNNVYIAGNEDGGGSSSIIGKLWKNSVAQNLSNGRDGADVKSVFVSGNDVYAAGRVERQLHYRAILWKNGVEQILSNIAGNIATSVYVSGNDVYVAGCQNDAVAKVWINGEEQKLTDGRKGAGAFSVFVKPIQ